MPGPAGTSPGPPCPQPIRHPQPAGPTSPPAGDGAHRRGGRRWRSSGSRWPRRRPAARRRRRCGPGSSPRRRARSATAPIRPTRTATSSAPTGTPEQPTCGIGPAQRGVVRRLRGLDLEAGRCRLHLPARTGRHQLRIGQLLRLGRRPRHLASGRVRATCPSRGTSRSTASTRPRYRPPTSPSSPATRRAPEGPTSSTATATAPAFSVVETGTDQYRADTHGGGSPLSGYASPRHRPVTPDAGHSNGRIGRAAAPGSPRRAG